MNPSIDQHVYRVYGLDIESEIELEEFVVVERSEQEVVSISYGVMPTQIQESISKGRRNGFEKNRIWFCIKDVATYYICDGKSIVVQPEEHAVLAQIKVYLMCSCMGYIMLQRKQVALHGGVMVMNGQAVVITGERGAGKSTLTTALRGRGYKFLSDDVAAIENREVPCVYHGFPYQKLCQDAMTYMAYDETMCEALDGDGKVKYMVPAHQEFVQQSIPLGYMFEIVPGDVEEVQIEQIKGQEKLLYVTRNIYRGEWLSMLGKIDPLYFKQCIVIAEAIQCYRVTRPRTGFSVDKQVELIENKVNQKR